MVSEKLEFNNKTTEGDEKDEWDLGDDEYEYWDEWVEDKLPDFEDKFPDESFPDVTENGTVLTSTATVDGSVTPAVTVITGKTPTTANVSPGVSVTPTANTNAGVTPTVTVNVNAALPVVVNISESPTSSVDIGLTQTATVNAKNKDGWSVSDTVGQDINKLTGDKPDTKKIQPNTANDLSGDKMNKGSGPKMISNTQKASSEEELQSAKKTDDNESHSSRLMYSSSVIGLSLFGLMLLTIA